MGLCTLMEIRFNLLLKLRLLSIICFLWTIVLLTFMLADTQRNELAGPTCLELPCRAVQLGIRVNVVVPVLP